MLSLVGNRAVGGEKCLEGLGFPISVSLMVLWRFFSGRMIQQYPKDPGDFGGLSDMSDETLVMGF